MTAEEGRRSVGNAPPGSRGPDSKGYQAAPLKGALYMLGATTCFAIMAVAIRFLADRQNALDVAFWRSVMGTLFLLPFMLRGLRSGAFKPGRPVLLLIRAGLTYVAMAAYFYAIANMVMVDAVALNATIPLFTTVLAALLLPERVGPLRWVVTGVGFGGAMIVLRPGLVEINTAALLAVLSAFFYASAGIIVKVLARTEPTTRIVFYMNLFLVMIAAGPALYRWNLPGWQDVPWLVSIGVAGTLAHVCITRAYTFADASFVAPFDFWRLVLVAAVGYVLFADVPSVWVWAGALIIFGSAVFLTRVEARRA